MLVTVLTVVMIGGVVVVVGLLVTRLSDDTPTLPEEITLPDGARAQAVTIGQGWYAIVTEDQRILIYDKTTGALKQEIKVDE